MRLLSPLAALAPACALLIASAALAPLAAQTAQGGQTQAPTASDAATTDAAASGDRVVARIGDDPLYLSDLIVEQLALPPQYQQVPLDQIFPQLITRVIERRLMAAEAERAGMQDDPDIARLLRRARDLVLLEAYATKHIQPLLNEAAVRARYERDHTGGSGEDEVHARHILVKSEADALAVIAELNGGADFAELAKTRSTGPSGPRGGDLGFFAKSAMVPPFAEAAFALQPGDVSGPVETQFGWHVIKVEERRQSAGPKFEEVRDQVRGQIAQEELGKILDGLREQNKVEIYNIDGKPVVGPSGAAPASK